MTPAQMKAFLDAGIPQAYAEGKAIQKLIDGRESAWIDLRSYIAFSDDPSQYRIKPEPPTPKARPFNTEEMRALLGKVITLNDGDYIVTGRDENGLIKFGGYWYSAEDLMSSEMTIDGKRCEVIE